MDVCGDIDRGQDDEADHGERQAADDVKGAISEMVGREREAKERYGADHVRSDGEQVGSDRSIHEAGDDLNEPGIDTGEWNAVGNADQHVGDQ